MNDLFEQWKSSYKELKHVKTITSCAMFGALAVILGYFSIQIGEFLKIGFSSIPNEIVAYLFGPVVAPCFGAVMDILKYMIKPTGAFFPGFTITAIVAGLINGMLLYRKRVQFVRVIITQFIVIVVCDIVLNTFWLSILYGKGFMVILPIRIIKNLIMWPIESIILFIILKTLHGALEIRNFHSMKEREGIEQ